MQKRYGVILMAAAVLLVLVSVHAGFAAEQKAEFKVPGVV